MNDISYHSKGQDIILDFPHKDKIFYEENFSHKGEHCFWERHHSNILSPKNIINWQQFTDQMSYPVTDLSLDQNFLFKGNNLLVLYTIIPFFRESVKLIYIDPPYNTGNSFVYKDKFSRSVWLLFMKNRIEIAKEFLKNDGVMVVQCDENEHAYLKILMDEIFGEAHFLGSITVITNPSGRDYRSLARTHEYLLIYGKTVDAQLYPMILEKEFSLHDEFGGFELRSLRNGNIRFHQGNRPNLYYPFYVDPFQKDQNGHHRVSLSPKEGWLEITPRESQGVKTVWRWGRDKVLNNISDISLSSHVIARTSGESFLIFEKYRKKTRLARTVWHDKEFYTSKGTKQIKELFGSGVFDYPKPELLMARILDITTKPGDRVMDFFLGSGTTVAVAHKAGRSWLGVEQMDYIHTITIPRLQKVLQGEQNGASLHYQWTGGGDFLYSELALQNDGFLYEELDPNNKMVQKLLKLSSH